MWPGLEPPFPGGTLFAKLALAASAVALTIYAVGLTASFRLPQPTAENLPEDANAPCAW